MNWPKPKEHAGKRRPISITPNQASLVLWVEYQNHRVLLGGDLEDSPSPNLGWQAIIRSGARPLGKALFYKVAHHGSPNADNVDIWGSLLSATPYVFVTPFLSGARPLPQRADKKRINQYTRLAWCTGSRTGWQTKRREEIVDQTARLFQRKLRAIEGPMGQIRARAPMDAISPPTVELFNGAQML